MLLVGLNVWLILQLLKPTLTCSAVAAWHLRAAQDGDCWIPWGPEAACRASAASSHPGPRDWVHWPGGPSPSCRASAVWWRHASLSRSGDFQEDFSPLIRVSSESTRGGSRCDRRRRRYRRLRRRRPFSSNVKKWNVKKSFDVLFLAASSSTSAVNWIGLSRSQRGAQELTRNAMMKQQPMTSSVVATIVTVSSITMWH